MGSLADEVVLDDQKEMDIPARASTKKKVTKKQTYLVPEKMGSLTDEVVLDDQKEMDIPARASTKKEVTKKTATGYLLDFEDETKREHGDEKMAKQWFQRFNNRDPNEEE